jgi:hypothetical protein
MPQKAQNYFNNTIFGVKNNNAGTVDSISHIVTSSGFAINYKNVPANMTYSTSYTFDQNKWYHICVKYDNTPSTSPNTGTATTQLWINGVSQTLQAQGGGSTDLWQTNVYGGGSIIRYTVTFMDDAYFGNIPNGAGFQTGYTGTNDYAIGNFKHFIATDGTNYSAKRAVPDYNTAADLFNEGAPDQSIITSGFIKSQGLSAIGNNKLVLSTSDTERLTILSGGNVGINTSSPLYPLDVVGDINMSTGSSFRINGVAQSFGGGGGGGPSVWSELSGNAYRNSGNVGINTSTPQYKLDVNGDIRTTSEGGFRGNGRSIVGISVQGERSNTIINFGQQSSLKKSPNGDPL